MNKNKLLLFMIACYIIPILYVALNYDPSENPSVSNVICDEQCKNLIMVCMLMMGIGTLLYERERKCVKSMILISILLIGLYGLIWIDERNKMHYVFASIVFIAIFLFMVRHCICNVVYFWSMLVELLLLVSVVVNMDDDIFGAEVVYILNFAFYYLYLHFIY